MEALATGYGLLEAPCADGEGGVFFSDVLGGGVYRWSPAEAVEMVIPKRRGVGGMCLHADGGLVVSGRDLVHVRDGESRTLLALEGVTGFNDLAPAPDGSVYVGALRFNPFAGEDPVPGDVWHVAVDGTSEQVLDDVDWPNGIGVSADGGTVYVCDYASGAVRAHELESGGSVEFARSPSGDADGLAMDAEGGVWVALGASGGVGRFSPGGELEEVLDVPADFVSSLCFGGPDGRDLYVTTIGSLFRARVDVAGMAVAPAKV
jgi:sugar lactone lactonase YvrE